MFVIDNLVLGFVLLEMGALTSRQNIGVEEVDIPSSSVYRYPPKSGKSSNNRSGCSLAQRHHLRLSDRPQNLLLAYRARSLPGDHVCVYCGDI